MPERVNRRRFLGKMAETTAGGILTFGLLGLPVVGAAILSMQEQARLRRYSKTFLYEIQVVEEVENPVFGPSKRSTVYYTDHELIKEGNSEHPRYTLREALYYDPHKESFGRSLQDTTIVPVSFSIREQFSR